MRLAYITPGAAGMICGSCLHDNTLAAALIRRGHDAALVPIYTPIRTDEEDVSIDRVFYGAVSVYLEQKSALFRHAPAFVDRILSSRRVLDWAAARGDTSIDAKQLGAMTLSMLQGEDGKQRKELERLVAWLRDEFRPDVVHLSNSMLVGMARRMRDELKRPVFCSLQGEDLFLEQIEEPFYSRVRETLRERARDADAFIATSNYYREYMTAYLDLPAERVHHVPLGLKLDGFATPPRDAAGGESACVIGYLARICPEKGLHLLVQAFRSLLLQAGPASARLRIAGWLGRRDEAYFEYIRRQVSDWGLDSRVDYCGEVDHAQKLEFLRSLDVLSVPTTYREPKGRFVLEALASGVPVVQPAHGAFPELIEATGGGLLVQPNSPDALAEALGDLIGDPQRRVELGRAGCEVVRREFDDDSLARRTLALYEPHL